jgi:hypothetical protein
MECLLTQLLQLELLLFLLIVVIPLSIWLSAGLIWLNERLRGNRIPW